MVLSIVICTYNRIRLLPFCLESILKQDYNKDDIEIILVNNNSTDNTSEYYNNFRTNNQKFPFEYFDETNQGLSFARNRGIKESKGEYVAFVDDDAILRPDYFTNIIRFIHKYPDCDAFGGKILVHFEGEPPKWENKYINSMFGYFNVGDQPFVFDKTNYPRGSNMIFKNSLIKEVGDFNTKLGRVKRGLEGNEEKDLFQRIYNAKKEVRYDPTLVVEHIAPVERTTISFVRKQANGTGYSENIRTKNIGGFAYLKKLIIEGMKWGATLLLFLLFLLKFQPSKGIILIRFRYWITSGILGIKYS
jgi:glycosyltransferase involved in cell wall biosynthesis